MANKTLIEQVTEGADPKQLVEGYIDIPLTVHIHADPGYAIDLESFKDDCFEWLLSKIEVDHRKDAKYFDGIKDLKDIHFSTRVNW